LVHSSLITPPIAAAALAITLASNVTAVATASGGSCSTIGVNSTTKGVDIVARYRIDMGASRLDLTAAANFNDTNITKTPGLPTLSSLAQPTFLFDRQARLTLEKGTPERKVVLSGDWTRGDLGLTLKVTGYDSVLLPQNVPGSDVNTGNALYPSLGAVTAGSALTISGVIKNGTSRGAGFHTLGVGDIVLTGSAPNTFTSLVRPIGGRIIICGTASVPKWDPTPLGPRSERYILTRRRGVYSRRWSCRSRGARCCSTASQTRRTFRACSSGTTACRATAHLRSRTAPRSRS